MVSCVPKYRCTGMTESPVYPNECGMWLTLCVKIDILCCDSDSQNFVCEWMCFEFRRCIAARVTISIERSFINFLVFFLPFLIVNWWMGLYNISRTVKMQKSDSENGDFLVFILVNCYLTLHTRTTPNAIQSIKINFELLFLRVFSLSRPNAIHPCGRRRRWRWQRQRRPQYTTARNRAKKYS